jgi:Arc/MetJ-type ribon-helix-helix transcriptional regulator
MASTERVAIRLTPDTIAVLDTLVQSGEFPTLSDVIMGAIGEFINDRFTAEDISKILEELSNKKTVSPESLMDSGAPTDMDAAVRAAVGNYVRNRLDGQR